MRSAPQHSDSQAKACLRRWKKRVKRATRAAKSSIAQARDAIARKLRNRLDPVVSPPQPLQPLTPRTAGATPSRQGYPSFARRPRRKARLERSHNIEDGYLASGVQDAGQTQPISPAIGQVRRTPTDDSLSPSRSSSLPLPHNQLDLVAGRRVQQQPLTTTSPYPGQTLPEIPAARGAGLSVLEHSNNVKIHNLNLAPTDDIYNHLREHIAHGSIHDSDERRDAPVCDEGTRAMARGEITNWIGDGDLRRTPKRVMWLHGPAGSGKSAIAGSVAEACKVRGVLAASVFFSSLSVNGRSSRGLVATLVHQLSQHWALKEYDTYVLQAIENRRDILTKTLREQAECLILEPLRKLGYRPHRDRTTEAIIVDGVNEIVASRGQRFARTSHPDHDDQDEVLGVLLALSQCSAFPFRILIVSRTEGNISRFFASDAAKIHIIERVLDSGCDPDADIKRFLKSRFDEIRTRSRISDDQWPKECELNRLVDMCSGQFVVAATMIQWVRSGVRPREQLDEVFRLKRESVGSINDHPFTFLDHMYRHILERAIDPPLVAKWIVTIASAVLPSVERIKPVAAKFWRDFLQSEEGELDLLLEPINSLVSIPSADHGSSPITICHKLLIDYLSNKSRSRDLYVDQAACDSFVTSKIVRVLKGQLRIFSSTTQEQLGFLNTFMNLRLVCDPSFFFSDVAVHKFLARFLDFLCEKSRAELAGCDVASWADRCLSTVPSPIRRSAVFIQGMYCGIHRAMECERSPLSSDQRITQQARDSNCHAACRRWRREILAKAKEHNWCVHRLEDVEPDHLETILWSQMPTNRVVIGYWRSPSS